MQESTIVTTGTQVSVTVNTNPNRVKDFTFGENNQHHIIQQDEEKNVISSITVDDGLGIGNTVVTVIVPNHNVTVTVTPENEVIVTDNSVQLVP